MGLVERVRLLIGGPETTKNDQFLPGNWSAETQIGADCNNAATGKTVNEQGFKQAIWLVRQRIQPMYTNLLEKIGVTDFSRQFRFLFASQVMIYLLGLKLCLNKLSIDSRLVAAVERQLKHVRIDGKELTVIATTSLPAQLVSNVVYLVALPSAGRDNTHFVIEVYFNKQLIHTEFKVSPNQQDEKLKKRIVKAIEFAIRGLK